MTTISTLLSLAVSIPLIGCAVSGGGDAEDLEAATASSPLTQLVNVAANRSVTAEGTVTGTPARLTDTVFAPEHAYWQDLAYAVVTPAGSALAVDLVGTYYVSELVLQADCNDSYRIERSTDGAAWQAVYTFGSISCPGLRTRPRIALGTPVPARYLRVSAFGGDAMYSVSELQAFALLGGPGCEPCTPSKGVQCPDVVCDVD
jgi:hypothetical protein